MRPGPLEVGHFQVEESSLLGFLSMILFFKPLHPIGGGTIELSKINDADVATLDKEFLELTYSDRERCETAAFVPDHVSLDKKVLHFKGSGSTFFVVLYTVLKHTSIF